MKIIHRIRMSVHNEGSGHRV